MSLPLEKSGTINPVVRTTGKSKVKPQISSSSELGVSSGSEEEKDVCGENVRIKFMLNDHTGQVCYLNITTVENGFDAKERSKKFAHTICADCIRRVFVSDRCRE